MDKIQILMERAILHQKRGELEYSLKIYQDILRVDNKNFDALHMCGLIYYTQKEYSKSINSLIKAYKINPNNFIISNNIGLILNDQHKFNEALDYLKKAVKINPKSAEANNNLANAYKNLGQLNLAHHHYKIAIEINPKYSEAFNNIGIVLQELDKIKDAIQYHLKAIELRPNFDEAYNSLGVAYTRIGLDNNAIKYFEDAIELNHLNNTAILNIANFYFNDKSYTKAINYYKKSLSIQPKNFDVICQLSICFYELNNRFVALELLNDIICESSCNFKIRTLHTVFQIPKIPASIEELKYCIDNFTIKLKNLEGEIKLRKINLTPEDIYCQTLFYSSYLGINNLSNLKTYAELAQNKYIIESKNNLPHDSDSKIKLGIVTKFIFDHPVWNAILKGIYSQINKNKFSIFTFHLNNFIDTETQFAINQSDNFLYGRKNYKSWCEIISSHNLDCILFPEIGIDPLTYKIASNRFCKNQFVSWGHPETSGLSTIDFFISGSEFESNDSSQFYSEKLIRLPNLSTFYYESNFINEHAFDNLNFDWKQPLLICPGSPQKYHPEYDSIFSLIIQSIPNAIFVFFKFGEETNLVINRIKDHGIGIGVNLSQNIRVIEWLPKPLFKSLLNKSTLYIDTIGFSGFNTGMLAIEADLPIVTLETPFLKGRLVSGILRRLGLNCLISNNILEFTSLIIELLKNPIQIESYRNYIKSNKKRLFYDDHFIEGFEKFIISIHAPTSTNISR